MSPDREDPWYDGVPIAPSVSHYIAYALIYGDDYMIYFYQEGGHPFSTINTLKVLQLSGIDDSSLLTPLGIPVVYNNLSDHILLSNIYAVNSEFRRPS